MTDELVTVPRRQLEELQHDMGQMRARLEDFERAQGEPEKAESPVAQGLRRFREKARADWNRRRGGAR